MPSLANMNGSSRLDEEWDVRARWAGIKYYYEKNNMLWMYYLLYGGKINSIIKDLEFHSAKSEDGKIVLYNDDYEPITKIPFEDYDESIKFIYAHKNGPVVYFVTAKAVDDKRGIMIINDDYDKTLSGAKRIDRIGANSYEYSTMH